MARQVQVLADGLSIPPPRTFRVRCYDINGISETLVLAHCWNAEREVITFMKWVPATIPGASTDMIEQRAHRGFRNWIDVEEVEDHSTAIN